MYSNWLRLLTITILLSVMSANAQNTIENFKNFVNNADLVCYEQKIQHDLNKFDKWLTDSAEFLKNNFYVMDFKPENVNLTKENKIFVLAITPFNTRIYNYNDNIYDYLVIDSLRTFIIVCVDDKMRVTGITDVEKPGTFMKVNDDFYFTKKKRNQVKKCIINIKKKNPDLILFCTDWTNSLLYIKGDKIYFYHMRTGKSKELNEYFGRSDIVLNPWKPNKIIPPDQLRMCPPLQQTP